MSTPAVVNIAKISASDITVAEPKKNKMGGLGIGFKWKGQNVQFRIPQITFPGGVRVSENANKDGSISTSYSLSGSLDGGDPFGKEKSSEPGELASAYNFLVDFKEKVVLPAAFANSEAWFGKKRGMESLRDSFKDVMSVSSDKVGNVWVPNGKYPPSLNMKLPVYDNQGTPKVYIDSIDGEGNPIVPTVSTLPNVFPKRSSAKVVAQASIWVVGQAFGVSFKPSYAQIYQGTRASAADFFKDDVPDEEEQETEQPVAPPPVTEEKKGRRRGIA